VTRSRSIISVAFAVSMNCRRCNRSVPSCGREAQPSRPATSRCSFDGSRLAWLLLPSSQASSCGDVQCCRRLEPGRRALGLRRSRSQNDRNLNRPRPAVRSLRSNCLRRSIHLLMSPSGYAAPSTQRPSISVVGCRHTARATTRMRSINCAPLGNWIRAPPISASFWESHIS
jgi:hypothetical protein